MCSRSTVWWQYVWVHVKLNNIVMTVRSYSNELCSVIIRVVPVFSWVIALCVRVLLWGVVVFVVSVAWDRWVAVNWGDQTLGSSSPDGWIGRRSSYWGIGTRGLKEGRALGLCFFICLLCISTCSTLLFGFWVRLLWVLLCDALFAHRARLFGLGEPRVDAFAVVCWEKKNIWKSLHSSVGIHKAAPPVAANTIYTMRAG